MTIRPATEQDTVTIHDLAHIIWPPTYNPILSPDQVTYMLGLFYTPESLLAQMKRGHHFILCADGDKTVGFASYEKLAADLYKLHKIYVLPDQQGKGTGKYMLEWVMNTARNDGAARLQLNVNKNNPARTFYEKMGFIEAGDVNIDIGNGYFMDDYVMERSLK